MSSEKKIGLVLGSGASRGWAHIGAIEAIEEFGLKISMITGASAGAFVGASYAGGGLKKLREFALNMDWRGVLAHVDIAFPRSGFMEGKKVAELIKKQTQIERLEELSIPLAVVATDLYTAEQIVLTEGLITDALRATMGVPGVMTPIRLNERWLVDGGVVNPLPVDVCRQMGADIVIAVDINSQRISSLPRKHKDATWEANRRRNEKLRLDVIKKWMEKYGDRGKTVSAKIDQWFTPSTSSPHIFDVLGSAINIMQNRIEKMNLQAFPPDLIIQPRLGDMDFFDFDEAEHAIDEGYRAAMEVLPDLEKNLAQFS